MSLLQNYGDVVGGMVDCEKREGMRSYKNKALEFVETLKGKKKALRGEWLEKKLDKFLIVYIMINEYVLLTYFKYLNYYNNLD